MNRYLMFCWLLLACCGSLLAEKHSIYTKETISDTVANSIANLTTDVIRSGETILKRLSSFQNTFDMDPAAFTVKFEVTHRTSRHIIFCLYRKEWATDPRSLSVLSRQGLTTQFECEALPLKHVLDGSSLYMVDKPAGN